MNQLSHLAYEFLKKPPGRDIWRFQSNLTHSSHTTKLKLKRYILFET